MNNQIEVIITENQLDNVKGQYILQNFGDYLAIAKQWEEKAKTIIVTSDSQTAEMKQAREGRLELKEKRVAVEKARKMLKEQSLREGKAIDSVAKFLTSLIEPIEDYLEQQEKFTENRIKAEKELLKTERNQLLAEFAPAGYPQVEELTEEHFNTVLAGFKAEKAEKERIEKEEAEKARLAEIARQEELQKAKEQNEKLIEEQRKAQQVIDEQNAKIKQAEEEAEKLRRQKEAEEKEMAKKLSDSQTLKATQAQVIEWYKTAHPEDPQTYTNFVLV